MHCNQCGNQLENDANFCSYCANSDIFESDGTGNNEESRKENVEEISYIKNNTMIGSILFISGIVIMALGIIAGIVVGSDDYGTMVWSITLIYWGSGFISGLFFIALGEIIRLIYNKIGLTNQKLEELEKTIKYSHTE